MKKKYSDELKVMSGRFNKIKNLLLLRGTNRILLAMWLLAVLIITITILFMKFLPLKDFNAFSSRQNSSRFYDSENNLIYVMPLEDGLRREYYSIEEIPAKVQEIFIKAEDKGFYSHWGISFSSIVRALKQNTDENRTVSGASTITMQLARLISPRKGNTNLGTKIGEMWAALRLELKLSKKQILEYYLNSLPFGNQIEGIASAARQIYSCSMNELSTAQILALAVTPRRPGWYSPLVNPENSWENAMLIGKNLDFYVSKEEWVKLVEPKPYKTELQAPHYLNWIISQYKNKGEKIPDFVKLDLDSKLNDLIQAKLQEQLDLFHDARISNGAALVIDNKTGAIIAWVGNADFKSEKSGQVDGVSSKHQSGSSTKPFLYALALENGYRPNQILADIPKDFGGQNVYVPLNFNNRYNGPQPMRVCLASSLNIPAVDILYHLGIDRYMNFLIGAGFDSLQGTRNSTGLSMALGSNEVSLLELTRGFSVFACDGIVKPVVLNSSEYSRKNEKQVLKSDTARVICDFLADRNAQSLGFGNAKVFKTSYPAIFKTGTANQFQDIISLCSTSRYTCGVWMGNLDGETVIKKTGSSIPAYICRSIMDYLTDEGKKSDTARPFKSPDSYRKVKVCALSGMKPGKFCSNIRTEFIKNSTDSENNENSFQTCNWHYSSEGITKIKYPSEYQHWASGKNMSGRGNTISDSSPLEIMYPVNNAVFFLDSTVPDSVQEITVLCCGGKDSFTTGFLDGNIIPMESERQAFKILLEKGSHIFTIVNGEETKSLNFSVK